MTRLSTRKVFYFVVWAALMWGSVWGLLHHFGFIHFGLFLEADNPPNMSDDAAILFREYSKYLEATDSPISGTYQGIGNYNLERKEPYITFLREKIIAPTDLITIEYFLDFSKTCSERSWTARRCAIAAREISRFQDAEVAAEKAKDDRKNRAAEDTKNADQQKRKRLGY